MTEPSDDLVKRLREYLGDNDGITLCDESATEITRLRAELTAMGDCKNDYATLAYERQERLFKLRAELAEAKRERDRFAAVIWLLVKHPHDSPMPEFKSAGEYCAAIGEAIALHRAKEEEKG